MLFVLTDLLMLVVFASVSVLLFALLFHAMVVFCTAVFVV